MNNDTLVQDPNVDHGSSGWSLFGQATEVLNISALERRASRGPETTGERRQDQLKSWINLIKARGKPVSVNALTCDDCGDSPFWMISRIYSQLEGYGAAWLQDGPGIQNITRESRSEGFTDLPVGEIDLKCAALQCVARRL